MELLESFTQRKTEYLENKKLLDLEVAQSFTQFGIKDKLLDVPIKHVP